MKKGISNEEDALLARIQQTIQGDQGKGGKNSIKKGTEISSLLGSWMIDDNGSITLILNMLAVRRTYYTWEKTTRLRNQKQEGEEIPTSIWTDYLYAYLKAYFTLCKEAFSRLPQNYQEGVALCSIILDIERERCIRIPIPFITAPFRFVQLKRRTPEAVYCECTAINVLKSVPLPLQKKALELKLWSKMPEVLYDRKGIAHVTADYISTELEKLLITGKTQWDRYPMLKDFPDICLKGEPQLFWRKKGKDNPGSFYEKMAVRISVFFPEAAREFERDAVIYVMESMKEDSGILTDNRIAVERVVSRIIYYGRNTSEQAVSYNIEHSQSGTVHSMGYY